MNDEKYQRKKKKCLARAQLPDPLQQEQGVQGLVALALSTSTAFDETVDALLQLLSQQQQPQSGGGAIIRKSSTLVMAVCQGKTSRWRHPPHMMISHTCT